MFLLDTDHLSLLERGGVTALALQIRLSQVPPDELATTIITCEEQMRGWLARSNQATTIEKMMVAYERMQRNIETFCDTKIVLFDNASAAQFEALRQARVRIGTMDLKIAAICLAHDATLLTRNLKDFGQVPGLKAEDWSV